MHCSASAPSQLNPTSPDTSRNTSALHPCSNTPSLANEQAMADGESKFHSKSPTLRPTSSVEDTSSLLTNKYGSRAIHERLSGGGSAAGDESSPSNITEPSHTALTRHQDAELMANGDGQHQSAQSNNDRAADGPVASGKDKAAVDEEDMPSLLQLRMKKLSLSLNRVRVGKTCKIRLPHHAR